MRILHVLDHSLPLQSGYVFRTLAILREQAALGWHTLQLTTPRHGLARSDVEAIEGWTFHRTPLGRPTRLPLPGVRYLDEMRATARRLGDLVREFAPDIVHAHSPVLNALPALWVARRHGLPVVYEVRALWEDGAVDHGTTGAHSARYYATRALETFALKRADHVTTICNGLQSEIAARGVPKERITVVPNAVDTSMFHFDLPEDRELAAKLGLAGNVVLGYVGSFYGYEGLDLLIEALAKLSQRRDDVRVLLVGGGPKEAALRAIAARLGVADRVVFAGRVPQGDVARYYSLSDLLVYPRHRVRVTELVTPLKPLEAMAQGRVLVASDVGGHRELIRHGETGYLFAAGSVDSLVATIESALARRDEWNRVRVQGRRFVETERTWTRSVARYASVYERLLRPSRAFASTLPRSH